MAQKEKHTDLIFAPHSLRRRLTPDGAVEVLASQRRGWLLLTPEEEVRRRVVSHLTGLLGIPATHIIEEYPVMVGGQAQRADIVAVDRNLRPFLVVECKAPEVPLSDGVVEQVVRYNSVIRAPQVLVTNGRSLRAFRLTSEGTYAPCDFPL